jgi:hypothetical protein
VRFRDGRTQETIPLADFKARVLDRIATRSLEI